MVLKQESQGLNVEVKSTVKKAAWLLTFSDLICLMLVFFVMQYAMSTVNVESWHKVNSAMQRYFEVDNEDLKIEPSTTFNISFKKEKPAIDLDYLLRVMQDHFNTAKNSSASALASFDLMDYVQTFDDRLVISLPGEMLFDSNSEVITDEGKERLIFFIEVFRQISNQIELIGHADPAIIHSGKYKNNWELSLARAISVSDFFKQRGYKKKIMAQGIADAEFGLLDPNLPFLVRRKMARKIDIVIHAASPS